MKQPLAGAIKSLWKNPWKLFVILTHYGFFTHIADEPYLRLVYRGVTGRRLRLDPPETYNEKMQWLKLHDKNPAYPKLVDKLAVREFVRECAGGALLNPLLGVWSDPRDIDFSALRSVLFSSAPTIRAARSFATIKPRWMKQKPEER